jgi:hypothetical protein
MVKYTGNISACYIICVEYAEINLVKVMKLYSYYVAMIQRYIFNTLTHRICDSQHPVVISIQSTYRSATSLEWFFLCFLYPALFSLISSASYACV